MINSNKKTMPLKAHGLFRFNDDGVSQRKLQQKVFCTN
ncbi:hypothetical protein J2X77_000778 [Sphingobacterium sp. 2149]|nr:hypothetical protein [Sphingobacterium sp. 2149]